MGYFIVPSLCSVNSWVVLFQLPILSVENETCALMENSYTVYKSTLIDTDNPDVIC